MPEFSITSFVSELKLKGFSKPYLFHLFIPDVINGNDLKFFAKTTSAPASSVNIMNVPFQGRMVKLPGERTFPEWTFTVVNDERYMMRRIFEDWLNAISGTATGTRTERLAPNYLTLTANTGLLKDIHVEQLSPAGEVLETYKIINAFPSTLSQLDFNWESTSNTQDFTVTIAYQYFTHTRPSAAVDVIY